MSIFKNIGNLLIKVAVEGFLISVLLSLLAFPVNLFYANVQIYIHTMFSEDYREFSIVDREMQDAAEDIRNPDRRHKIIKKIELIKKYEKKGTYGAAYSLGIIYAYGIPGAVEANRLSCGYYRIKSIRNFNPSGFLIDC